jgi:eukaryotic-like serine/threonine-protein kinase
MTTDRASAALSKGTAAPDPIIGRVISGRFKITALIARGGMGRVYRAEQAPLGRICAIKVLNPNYAGEHDPEFHRRFFLEASIASKLTHPNTVTIFDYGRTDDDVYYMAMEYLEGQTLHRAIRDAGHLPEERAVHVARQVCRSLREAHSLGVIHRDLKPANIFLVDHGDEPDFVKVLDFGLVKNFVDKGEDLTQTGMFMGSPKYMAPEQIRGDRVDARTDIYALGIILYEMLTGKVPFDRPTSVNILMAHVHEQALPMRQTNPVISVSAAIEETVMRCMAKEPDKRFRSMSELLDVLKGGGAAAATAATDGSGAVQRSSNPAAAGLPVAGSGGVRVEGSRVSEPPPSAYLPGDTLGVGGPRASPRSSGSGSGSGSKGVLVAAVAGALAVAAVIGYVAVRPPGSASSASMTASAGASAAAGLATAPGAPSVAAAAVATLSPAPSEGMAGASAGAAPGATSRVVHVTTDPDGASVKEEGVEVCGSTPCDVLYKGDDADPAREHKLTLTQKGYRQEVRTIKTGDSSLSVKLVALPRPSPPTPARGVDPPVPTGYKTDIPY